MAVVRTTCMVVVMMGLAAEFARVAPSAMWSWLQVQKILAADAGRQRQFDGLDPALEMTRHMTTEPAA